MVFEHIEKLKQEYTDKYVMVDEGRPELKRFRGMTGTVRTVNMSGRALVEFDGLNNIGWYDIDLDFLKVIDAPLSDEEKEGAAKKAAAKKKAKPKAKAPAAAPSELEKARKEKAAEEAKGGGGLSTAEILAAARANKAAAEKTEPAAGKTAEKKPAEKASPKPAPGKMSAADVLAAARAEKKGGGESPSPAAPAKDPGSMSAADVLAAARGEKSGTAPDQPAAEAAPPAKVEATEAAPKTSKKIPPGVDPTSMTVEQMLAAARGSVSGASTAKPAAEEPPAEAEPPAEETPAAEEAPAAEETPPAEEAAPEEGPPSSAELPTDLPGMIAYCRRVDGGG